MTVLEMLVRDPEHTQNSGIHAQALRVSDSDCSGNGFVLSLLISCPNVLWFTLAKQEKKMASSAGILNGDSFWWKRF